MIRFAQKLLFWTILSTIICLTNFGCTEERRQDIDRAADKTQDVVGAGRQALDSPAGQMIPGEWRVGLTLAGALAAGCAGAWQNWRNSQMKKTTKAIVKGIENATKTESNPQTGDIKAAIAQEMKAANIYDRGHKIVDRLKIT